jgi:hypothetical protein
MDQTCVLQTLAAIKDTDWDDLLGTVKALVEENKALKADTTPPPYPAWMMPDLVAGLQMNLKCATAERDMYATDACKEKEARIRVQQELDELRLSTTYTQYITLKCELNQAIAQRNEAYESREHFKELHMKSLTALEEVTKERDALRKKISDLQKMVAFP